MSFTGKYKELLSLGKMDAVSISVLLTSMHNSHGGIGANIAYTLALLGETPILVSSVGQEARDYVAKLESLGVDTSSIHVSDLPTASFNVITDSDSNQIGGFYPGAMLDSESLTLEKWKNEEVIVIISAHDPKAMRRQIEECSSYRLPVCFDIGQQIVNTAPQDLAYGVSQAEILILNQFELAVLCKKIGMSPKLLKSKIPLIITTLGEKGSVIEGKNVPKKIKIKAVKPDNIAGPTGAGDAYRAGFFYGYIRGWDLKTCGQMGAVAASFAVAKHGTQEHIFTREEFMEKYRAGFRKNLLLI